MKKRPHNQSNESAKDQGHVTAQSTATEALRQRLIKDLFPKKTTACFECRAKLTDSNRKRIVTVHPMSGGMLFSGHQVCKPCAVLLQAGEFQKLPKIERDIATRRFELMGAKVNCVGGLQ